jgi:hypothetical protein
MIVRISGEDQYRLSDDEKQRLDELESKVGAAIDSADDSAFRGSFGALLDYVRQHGSVVPDDELESSDLILPPPDVTLAEARDEFTGDGLLPD